MVNTCLHMIPEYRHGGSPSLGIFAPLPKHLKTIYIEPFEKSLSFNFSQEKEKGTKQV